jgi:agmatine/peptidylarginine deiminase
LDCEPRILPLRYVKGGGTLTSQKRLFALIATFLIKNKAIIMPSITKNFAIFSTMQ